MKDIIGSDKFFEGMVVLLGGDFRQVLLIVAKEGRRQLTDHIYGMTANTLKKRMEILRKDR